MQLVSSGIITLTDTYDGISLLLSSYSSTVPADDLGNGGDFTGCSTTAKVMLGIEDITSYYTLTINKSASVTGSLAGNIYTVTAMSTDTGAVEISASRSGYPTLTAKWSITKIKKGSSGLTIILSKEGVSLPSLSNGIVTAYANSGTTIEVFEGDQALTAASNTTALGSFTVGTPTVTPASSITVGGISFSGSKATVGDHSAMNNSVDALSINYPITVKRRDGSMVSFNRTQSVTKSKQNAPVNRGTVHLYVAIAGSSWIDSAADSALAAAPYNGKIVADRVTEYNQSVGFSQTRSWSGTTWDVIAEVVDGNLLVTQSITANKININDLFSKNATITGQLTVGTATDFVKIGGNSHIIAQAGSRTLFSVSTNSGLIDGYGLIAGSVQDTALSASALERIRSYMGASAPSAGGVKTMSAPASDGSFALPVFLSSMSPVSIYFAYLGSANFGVMSSSPALPRIVLKLFRGGVVINEATYYGQSTLADNVNLYEKELPDINYSYIDNSPGAGNLAYVVTITTFNFPATLTGNATLTSSQTASGSGPSAHTHDAADIVSGVLPVTRGGTGAGSLTGLIKGNGTSAFTAAIAGTDYVLPSGNVATATRLQTARAINGSSFDGSGDIQTTEWVHSTRDFPNGTLIRTSIDYSVTSGDPFILKIEGNAYGNNFPFDIQYQGYIYSDTIINHRGISNGHMINGLVALNDGGYLCFWFPYQSYWQGFNVIVYTAYQTRAANRVTSIEHRAKPAGTKEVALSANIAQTLNSYNYTSYAPSLAGSGAYGTWNISITGSTGSAATLQTPRLINGTSFNGSSDITTSTWGTARTVTIGNTGKSINGSANTSWSLAEIGALPTSGGTVTGTIYGTTFSSGLLDFGSDGVVIRTGTAGGGWAKGFLVLNSSMAAIGGAGFYGTASNNAYRFSVGFDNSWWNWGQFEVTVPDTTVRNRLLLNGSTLSSTMMTVYAPMSSLDDWQESPISIKQRTNGTVDQLDNRYAPNLNFHWSGWVSMSLWMNSSGELSYGSYTTTGTPNIDGSFRAGTLYATGNVTAWNYAFASEYRFNSGDVRLIPSSSGFGVHTNSGAAQKIFTGGILVSDSYTSGAIANVPYQGIYSVGGIWTQGTVQSNGLYVLDGREIRHGYWRHFTYSGLADNIGTASSGEYRKFVKICNANEILGVYTIRISLTGGYNYASGQGETIYLASGNHHGPTGLDVYTWNVVQAVGNIAHNAEIAGLVIYDSSLGFWLHSTNNNDFTIHMSVRAGSFPPSLGLYGLGTAVERPCPWPTAAEYMLRRPLTLASIRGSNAYVKIYQDSGFTNFETDRSMFYFNKPLRIVSGIELQGTNWFFGSGSQARINQINARHLEGLATDGQTADNVYINYLANRDVHIGNRGAGGATLIAVNRNNEVMSKWLTCWDQRARGLAAPNAYGTDLSLEFLGGGTAGNSGVDYLGTIVFRPYGGHVNDWSGGPMHKIHFDQKLEGNDGGIYSGRIWHQTGNGSGWHSFKEIAQYEPNNYLYARSWINIPDGTGLFWNSGSHFFSSGNGQMTLRGTASTSYIAMQTNGGSTQGFLYAEVGGHIGLLGHDANWALQIAPNKMVYVTDITASSDSRLKDNQRVIENPLQKLNLITGKTYNRNDQDGKVCVGVIAQDVLCAMPELVCKNDRDMYSVNYNGLTALLVEANKQLHKELNETKSELHNMAKSVEALLERIEMIEKRT